MILERDKERGRRRTHCGTSRTSATKSQPKSGQPRRGGPSLACCCVAPPRRVAEDTPSSLRLASVSNLGLQMCPLFIGDSATTRSLRRATPCCQKAGLWLLTWLRLKDTLDCPTKKKELLRSWIFLRKRSGCRGKRSKRGCCNDE